MSSAGHEAPHRSGGVADVVATAPACSRGGGTSEQREGPFVAVDPNSQSATDRAIAKAQQRLRAAPKDGSAQLDLAQAFLQKARETADPSLYVKAAKLLDLVSKQSPSDLGLVVTKGTLALAQHRFRDALTLGQLALNRAPDSEAALGVVVDANNELGRYPQALKATQQMVDIRPEPRQPVACLLRARAARRSGRSGGRDDPGRHRRRDGRRREHRVRADAARQPAGEPGPAQRSGPGLRGRRAIIPRLPRSPGGPGAGARRRRAATPRRRSCSIGSSRSSRLRSTPIAEGDALAAAGQKQAAAEAYDLVAVIARLYRANGVNVDLELALFDADHHPGRAVGRARRSAEGPARASSDTTCSRGTSTATARYPRPGKNRRGPLRPAAGTPSCGSMLRRSPEAAGARTEAVRDLQIVLDTNPRFSAALVDDVQALAGKARPGDAGRSERRRLSWLRPPAVASGTGARSRLRWSGCVHEVARAASRSR